MNNIIIILLFVAFLYMVFYANKNQKVNNITETFVTNPPPEINKKDPHWQDNYAMRAQMHNYVTYSDKFVNWFPIKKPPATLETLPNGEVDLSREQLLPNMIASVKK